MYSKAVFTLGARALVPGHRHKMVPEYKVETLYSDTEKSRANNLNVLVEF